MVSQAGKSLESIKALERGSLEIQNTEWWQTLEIVTRASERIKLKVENVRIPRKTTRIPSASSCSIDSRGLRTSSPFRLPHSTFRGQKLRTFCSTRGFERQFRLRFLLPDSISQFAALAGDDEACNNENQSQTGFGRPLKVKSSQKADDSFMLSVWVPSESRPLTNSKTFDQMLPKFVSITFYCLRFHISSMDIIFQSSKSLWAPADVDGVSLYESIDNSVSPKLRA